MYKNQLQELAQRSCFNLPSYACIREGPDHAPRFRASVNFLGEIFEGPSYCPTLRQAEHAAAEVALNNLSAWGTARSLAARVLDETGVYKNLLQETAHRAGLKLPVYITVRSGPGHQPIFSSSVELAGMSFSGEPAKTKKQAEKNAAMAAWSALKEMPNLDALQPEEVAGGEEHEQAVVASVLSNFKPKEENRPTMHMDQPQRRTIASPHNALGFRDKWRRTDPLSDGSSIYSAQQPERLRGFSAPAPPSGPKILYPLPLVTRSSNVQASPSSSESSSSSSSNNNRRFPTLLPSTRPMSSPLVGSWKKDDVWMNEIYGGKGKSTMKDQMISRPIQEFGPRPSYQTAIPLPHQRTLQTHRPFCPPPHTRSPMGNLSGAPVPRTMVAGGFRGVAPAVHVRSVIPVCAAPPPMRSSPNTSGNQKRESEEEISVATSKINKLQLVKDSEP